MEFLHTLFGTGGFLPHGYCFTWTPSLLWSMVGADGVIAAAYFSIPAAILSFVRKRREPAITPVAILFGAFIFSCGITHLMDIWTIWRPDYGLQALTKTVTAVISIATAIALWWLIPRALRVPSVQHLQAVVASLEAEAMRRRDAEQLVVDIQQSLAVTLASIGAGFLATDRAGRVTRMNAVAEQLLGWTQAEAAGRSLWQVFDREDRPYDYAARNPVDVAIAQQTTVETVHRLVAVSRQGRHTPIEVQVALTRAEDESVLGLAMVFRDMTRLEQAETVANRLAAIVASSGDAIIGKTLGGEITDWNEGAQRIFGYTPQEAIGQSVRMLIPPERQAEEMRILALIAHGDSVPAFDTVRLTRNGAVIDVSVTISPIRDGTGRLVGASKIARDVTLQRRAEAALRASDERLRFTLESTHVGDWELDLASGAMQHSLRNDRCFGYTELQAEWSLDKLMGHVHPDDRAEVERSYRACIDERCDWRTEFRVVWPDGSVHGLSLNGSMLFDGERPTRLLGIVSDITEQRLAEQARQTAQRLEAENRQIQEASRLKSQFVANMSHELRTPLNAVIGFADLLHSGFVKPESAQHHEFLGHIAASGRHLLQLINDVLDLSKVEAGKFDFVAEPIDLPALLQEVKDTLHPPMQRKGIRLSIELDPALTDLRLDAARLRQVLYNYLSNAIKFSHEGGSVSVRIDAEGARHFRIEVEDAGIGISAADLPRLFTDFQQLDAGYGKQHQGTGLGLALTRRLVEAQGGSVGVRSSLGSGSVFHARLNREHGFDAQRAAAIATGQQVADARRVLVVEEVEQGPSLLAAAFRDAGFEVDAAGNAPQALERARATTYAAMSLDLRVDQVRGLDLLAGIRSGGASHATPVVAMAMPADSTASANFAIANVLAKPIRSDEILAAMGRIRAPTSRRARVLVIDDEQVSLDLMQATLNSIGIDAVCCLDGRAALQDIDRHRPDAIVLDLMMPGFDGFQTLDELQRLPAWRDVPVFIWTSMLLTDEEYATLARSARAILLKGGGALAVVLESVRRWREPVAPAHTAGSS